MFWNLLAIFRQKYTIIVLLFQEATSTTTDPLVFIESEIGPKHVSANYKNKIKMP
jgi:hypothetical protein